MGCFCYSEVSCQNYSWISWALSMYGSNSSLIQENCLLFLVYLFLFLHLFLFFLMESLLFISRGPCGHQNHLSFLYFIFLLLFWDFFHELHLLNVVYPCPNLSFFSPTSDSLLDILSKAWGTLKRSILIPHNSSSKQFVSYWLGIKRKPFISLVYFTVKVW